MSWLISRLKPRKSIRYEHLKISKQVIANSSRAFQRITKKKRKKQKTVHKKVTAETVYNFRKRRKITQQM